MPPWPLSLLLTSCSRRVVEPASSVSPDANSEPVSKEPVALLDGEMEELQLGTAETTTYLS